MSEHLPECCVPWPDGSRLDDCICDRLRACEQRVWDENRRLDIEALKTLERVTLARARDAVAACKTHTRRRNTRKWGAVYRTSIWVAVKFKTIDRDVALAAIDALRGES